MSENPVIELREVVQGMRDCWRNMHIRCEQPDNEGYKHYGGRGIKVCERWSSFANFIYDMGLRPAPDLQLDRIDNDGNYESDNCRWADRLTNMRNRSNAVYADINGERMRQWQALDLGISKKRFYAIACEQGHVPAPQKNFTVDSTNHDAAVGMSLVSA